MHLGADALAHGVFGFLGIEGDQALLVARHHMRAARHVAEKVEGQPVHRIGMPAHHRQAEREQLRDQAALGHLELAPEFAVGLHRQVGNGARDAAGQAVAGRQALRVGGNGLALARLRHHPVAGGRRHEVGAAAVGGAVRVAEDGEGVGQRALAFGRRQRHHAEPVDHVAQRRVAGQALAVAQEHGAPALAAVGAADGGGGEFGRKRGGCIGYSRVVAGIGGRWMHGLFFGDLTHRGQPPHCATGPRAVDAANTDMLVGRRTRDRPCAAP
ncbi:hypothetical protein FQZ97_822950 [compost metagenome]